MMQSQKQKERKRKEEKDKKNNTEDWKKSLVEKVFRRKSKNKCSGSNYKK